MATKKQNIRSIRRKAYITQEIEEIMRQELHKMLQFAIKREDSLTGRLNSIESNGVPQGTVDEIKREVGQLRHTINRQTKALEQLLAFFNATKNLLNESQ